MISGKSVGEEPKDSLERFGQRNSIKAIEFLHKLKTKRDVLLREVNIPMGKEDAGVPQQVVHIKES